MHGPGLVKNSEKNQKPKIIFISLNLIKNVYFYIRFDSQLIALSEFMTIFAKNY